MMVGIPMAMEGERERESPDGGAGDEPDSQEHGQGEPLWEG